jgi:hypothetical protein
MNFEAIAVGEIYPFKLPSCEGVVSDFLRSGSNRLLIAINDISRDEEKTLRKGELRCGMLAKNGAVLLIWQFRDNRGKPLFTLESPFDARLIKDIQLYDVSNSKTRINIDIHIVDLSTKLIRGLRSITMPPSLTVEFLSAVQDQLATLEAGNNQHQRWMSIEPHELTTQTQKWLMGT